MKTALAARYRAFTTLLLISILGTWLSLGFPQTSHAQTRAGIDFTHYNTPLYQQITDRIAEKIATRLGEGTNPRDRYFIIPFAYQNRENDPEFSHSFITVVRVLADHKQPRKNLGLKTGIRYNREYEAYNISWLPDDFDTNPNLCVFNGFGARLFPSWNKCPTSNGKNFNLETTIKLGVNVQNAVCMWGPYEVAEPGFTLGMQRKELLDGGTIDYRADDRITRKKRTAINCFHAMAGLDELYPNGGLFGTGFKMWGINGTARVLIEYKNKANIKGLLLEPVDVKKDRVGFIYVSPTGGQKVYNPFKTTAFAYYR